MSSLVEYKDFMTKCPIKKANIGDEFCSRCKHYIDKIQKIEQKYNTISVNGIVECKVPLNILKKK